MVRITALALLASATLGLAACRAESAPGGRGSVDAPWPAFHGSVNEPAPASPALRLKDQNGRPFDLADQRGKVVALFWGYLSCPDVCPMTLARLVQVRESLAPEDRARFQVVMVTVDPMRDDAEAMKSRLNAIDPSFIGLVGSPDEIDAAMRAWGVVVERSEQPVGGDRIAHPGQIMFIDPAGRFLLSSHHQAPPDQLLSDVRGLLRMPAVAGISEVERRPEHSRPDADANRRFDGPAVTWPASGARSGEGPVGWLQSHAEGSVWLRQEEGRERILASWSERRPAERIDIGTDLGAPSVAYDPVERRLWYSDTHDAIRSRSIDDGAAGPVLEGFSDTAIPGCGVATSGRVFALDPQRRRLYAPLLTGQVLAYDIDSLDVVGGLPAAGFEDLVLGRYRLLAVDPGRGLWIAGEAGALVEFDPDRARPTGRRVQAEAEALLVEAGTGMLYVRESEGWRALSLETLEDRPITLETWVGLELEAAPSDAGAALVHRAPVERMSLRSAGRTAP